MGYLRCLRELMRVEANWGELVRVGGGVRELSRISWRVV